MKTSFVVVFLAFFVSSTRAACPNGCSGRGTCGTNDACTCFHNFKGGDCSKRVCPYHESWVMSPNGDLNHDGDALDGTVYSPSHLFSASASDMYLQTQHNMGGEWETWPHQHSSTTDEGHFYKECSNKGVCDTITGTCKCFEGYTGTACQRTNCPKDCSGKGRCLTVNQLADGTAYKLWDGDMTTACKCDAGYIGADCSQRTCSHGDDIMTKEHQVNEVQWAEVKSTCDTDASGAGSAVCTGSLDGTFTMTVTDKDGDTYTTDAIDVQAFDGTAAAIAMGPAVKAALEALPNDVVSTVTVTSQYCETALPGSFAAFAASSGTDPYPGTLADPIILRCPGYTTANGVGGDIVTRMTDAGGNAEAKYLINGFAGAGATYEPAVVGTAIIADTNGDIACNRIEYEQCARFKVQFSDPGNIAAISLDVSSVTRNSKTNAGDSNILITGTVSDQLVISNDAASTVGWVAAFTVTTSDGTITTGTKTIDLGSAAVPVGSQLPAGATIELTCATRVLGQFTVATHVDASGSSIVVDEDIIADNMNCASASSVTVRQVTEFISTNIDLTGTDLAALVPKTSLESEGSETTVSSTQYTVAKGGFMFLTGTSSYSTTFAQAAGTLSINGAGTKENNECGDRGICDRDSGVCKCFRGYEGDACSLQNSLAI